MSDNNNFVRNADNLKKDLTLPLVFCVGLKQIIGAGFIAFTGMAIAMTGAGVPLAYFLAALTSILAGIPFAILGSAMPVTGGMYSWPSRILSPMTGFMSIWIFFLSNFTLSIYALTASGYIQEFYPNISPTFCAITILTVFYILNLVGAKATATVGMFLTIILLMALVLFIGMGLPKVNPGQLSDILPKGVPGLMSAGGLLIFTTFGAALVAELGGEMKNPGRDIPITIIGATSLAALLYVLGATVAVGVLPIETVAGQKLTIVANEVMSHWAFVFFTVAAGIISIMGVINAQMLWGSKSLLVACDDNWLPRWLGTVNKRFGTPHFLLSGLYLLGVLPILTGLSINDLATSSNITAIMTQIIVVFSCYMLYRKYQPIYNQGLFKIKNGVVLLVLVIFAVTLNAYLVYSLFDMIGTWTTFYIIVGWVSAGFIIALLRRNYVTPYRIDESLKTPAQP